MPRGLGDVMDAYVECRRASPLPLRIVVALDPGGFLAARVAARLIELLGGRDELAVAACDARARALIGASGPAARSRRAKLEILLATSPPASRPDGILWIAPAETIATQGPAPGWTLDANTPLAAISIGPLAVAVPGAGWVAFLSTRAALRVALGSADPALRTCAADVRRWLIRLHRPPSANPLGLSPLPNTGRE